MTKMEFKVEYKNYLDNIENHIKDSIPQRDKDNDVLISAMEYSLLAGGKRIRPILAVAICDMLGGDVKNIIPFAIAIEMIHTYSLIHDDLPSMDDDEFRRGKKTNHKVFGEDIAILSGDALLNYAFEYMIEKSLQNNVKPLNIVNAIKIVSNASGYDGMIGGQVIDIKSEGIKIDLELLKKMHRKKTGALITAPCMVAANLCGLDAEKTNKINSFAHNLGLAFQIKDDILDVEGNLETLGKDIGSDYENNKSTYVTIYGLDKAKEILNDVTKKTLAELDIFGEKAEFLRNITKELASRKN